MVMPHLLASPVVLSHYLLEGVVRPGDLAVDATAGNGHDTLFLARLVGDEGKVYAFDIQEEAIQRTAARLAGAGLEHRVVLLNTGHERLHHFVPRGVRAVVFNLGYLPGGDHSVTTRPETTVQALARALEVLAPGGIVTVVVYRGHPGGEEEGRAVADFVASLEARSWAVLTCGWPNRSERAPCLVAVQKVGEGDAADEAPPPAADPRDY